MSDADSVRVPVEMNTLNGNMINPEKPSGRFSRKTVIGFSVLVAVILLGVIFYMRPEVFQKPNVSEEMKAVIPKLTAPADTAAPSLSEIERAETALTPLPLSSEPTIDDDIVRKLSAPSS